MTQDTPAPVEIQEAASTVNATYVEPSATEMLPIGAKVANQFTLTVTRPYWLQRLTQRTYFFAGGFYTATFYVGDEGVLVLDPPENQGQNMVAAIAEVTDLPVRAIVYSHNHADHIISAQDLLDASAAAGVNDVRIIASTRTAEKMELVQSKLPRPTETIDWPRDSFTFEGLTVEFHGFERASHCDDAGPWLLVQERVVHLPDLVNGDQPPFRHFAESENYLYYRGNVNDLGALEWDHLVGGHGNVGSKEDIAFYNTYLDDLEAAVGAAMASTQFGDTVNMDGVNNHAQLMVPWLDAVIKATTDQMRPKYGEFYGFEITVPANAEMVILSFVSYR